MSSITVKPKKRGRPATGKDPLVGVRMPPDLVAKLDDWCAKQAPAPSRSAAIRAFVEAGLSKADSTKD
ncbi:MAG: hypothetical protein B7Y61_08740 [Rhizobiales bacterium 35-66-30]|jgi:metal-responsive CopG/Arc/MetJ family transcriptional regulator|nr:MAG: hypothetical protein B7Y61_08740 [Rhizobiales bacterium 35-66-30]OZA98803.1 MAG: hypothetical protein B7X67_21625 [Rhizobiales bacterium 39-66-18]